MTAVELHEVTFVRHGRDLLADISLEVRRGAHWALIGPNRAGKSTLLNISGAVTFPNRPLTDRHYGTDPPAELGVGRTHSRYRIYRRPGR